MRPNDAVESVKSHAEYEESTTEAETPNHCRNYGAIPVLIRRHFHLMSAVQIG